MTSIPTMTAKQFKAARRALNMTVAALGAAIGARPRTVRGFETDSARSSAREIPWWAVSRMARLKNIPAGVIRADGFKIRLRPPGVVMTDDGTFVAWLDAAPDDPGQAQAILDEVGAA